MKTSLRERIIAYLKKRDYFVASGDIQRLALENGYYSPSNASRRLRELHQEGILEVEYRKSHAFYRFKGHDSFDLRRAKKLDKDILEYIGRPLQQVSML